MQIWLRQPRGIIRINFAMTGGLRTLDTMLFWSRLATKYLRTNKKEFLKKYYINTSEIPSELSRENLVSSRVKIRCIFTREKITVAMVTCGNRAFRCLL